MRNCLLTLLLCVAAPALALPVAPGVELIPGEFVPGTQPDGNSVVFEAPAGLVVVDSGRHVEHTQAILNFASALERPIAALVNSHWHLDHVGGNPRLRRAYPQMRVYASDALGDALHGFLAHYRQDLVGAIAQEKDPAQQQAYRDEIAIIDSGEGLKPDEVISVGGERTIAGKAFVIGLETHAVTAGDVWVFDPQSRVLASGDLVTLPVPFLDTACPQRWRQALQRLDAVKFNTLLPGHGPALSHAQFAGYRQAFDGLLDCAASKADKQVCIDGWVHDAAPLNQGADEAFVRKLAAYYLDSSLRAPAAHNAPLCGA
jgi:glyoxylase-like metal-dependent hydrolase (beta-lactamase superfamily II)